MRFVTTKRKGAAAMELGVLLPFLGIFLIGMFEIGRATLVAEALEDAARKGCNTGIRPGFDYTDIISDVNGVLTANNIDTDYVTTTVQVAPVTNSSSIPPTWGAFAAATSDANYSPLVFDLVSVKVAVQASKVLWFKPFFLKNLDITSSTVVMLRAG